MCEWVSVSVCLCVCVCVCVSKGPVTLQKNCINERIPNKNSKNVKCSVYVRRQMGEIKVKSGGK